MSNKKQTAVEWLFLMLNNPNRDQEFANKLLEKAKEMENQQHAQTFNAGFRTEKWDKTKENKFETYFNETFKSEFQEEIEQVKQPETIIDWSKVPDGYDWVAMDENGNWYSHKICPYLSTHEWFNSGETEYIERSIIKNPPTDWTQCKFKRP
ncbi:MAG: hypothetical protein FGM14_15085 [Flavobacteriales bacterium]|nr:hypothetical protein [Flavobacteriales bacterium]